MLGSRRRSLRFAGSKPEAELHLYVIGMVREKQSISFRFKLEMISQFLGGNPGREPKWNYRGIGECSVHDSMKLEGRILKLLR